MKKYNIVWNGDYEFQLTQFFDIDSGCDGIDVAEIDGNGKKSHIGEIWDITIPDETDKEEVEKFETHIINWLEENYVL
jgi:hypothetical protein